MGFSEGMRIGLDAMAQAAAEREAARKAEWEAEVHARQRKLWDQEDADLANLQAARGGLVKHIDSQLANPEYDASGTLGMQQARYSPAMDSAAADNGGTYAPAPQARKVKYDQGYLDNLGLMKNLAPMLKDPQALLNLQTSIRDGKVKSEAAGIYNHFMGLDDAGRDELMGKIHSAKENSYEATKNKDGTWGIKVGASTVNLSPAQAAEWLANNHAYQASGGDVQYLKNINAIDEKLAAKAKDTFERAKGTATINNQAFTAASNDAYHKGSLGIQREQARNAKMGAPITAYDKDNNPIIMVPTMTNGKMTFERVTLPEGARLPKQPQTLTDQEKIAYENWVKTEAPQLAGKPPAEVAMSMRRYGLDPMKLGVSDPTAEIAEAIRRKQSGGATQQTPQPTGVVPEQQMPTTSAEAYARWRELSPSAFSLPRFGDNYRGKQADAEQAARAEQMLRLFHQLQAQGK